MERCYSISLTLCSFNGIYPAWCFQFKIWWHTVIFENQVARHKSCGKLLYLFYFFNLIFYMWVQDTAAIYSEIDFTRDFIYTFKFKVLDGISLNFRSEIPVCSYFLLLKHFRNLFVFFVIFKHILKIVYWKISASLLNLFSHFIVLLFCFFLQ